MRERGEESVMCVLPYLMIEWLVYWLGWFVGLLDCLKGVRCIRSLDGVMI